MKASDAHGRTALHHCVDNSNTACAEILLKADCSLVFEADDEGLFPLHMAVIASNVPLLRLLLKSKASINCRDMEGHTLVHWATGTFELSSLSSFSSAIELYMQNIAVCIKFNIVSKYNINVPKVKVVCCLLCY